MTKKTDEDKRLRDIQNHLVKHIEKEIQDEDDLYVYGYDVTQTQHGSVQDVSVRR